jgi:hypothetical protein
VQLPQPLDPGALIVEEARVQRARHPEAALEHNVLVLRGRLALPLLLGARLLALLPLLRRRRRLLASARVHGIVS